MQWLNELLRPALKCARVGHKMRVQKYRFFRPTSDWRAVADQVTEEREKCRRCGHTTEWRETRVVGLQSLRMSHDKWEEMEGTGRTSA